jgi:HPt (histidine-containing phosphotransfer) domain-containing protein
MEISIDLRMIREIVFKDDNLLKEMLIEWVSDSNDKLAEIKNRMQLQNIKGLFNKIHELKTNFTMIHCPEGIQLCEAFINKIENQSELNESEFDSLALLILEVNNKLLPYIHSTE